MPRPHGHECQRRNICFECQGRLRARRLDGFSEIMYDDGVRAFAAPVCRTCKLVHTELREGPRVPYDFKKRLELLRDKLERLPPGTVLAVAGWQKEVQEGDRIRIRTYIVNTDKSVVTLLRTHERRNPFSTTEGNGWKPYEVKGEYKMLPLLRKVEASLEAQGYGRLF